MENKPKINKKKIAAIIISIILLLPVLDMPFAWATILGAWGIYYAKKYRQVIKDKTSQGFPPVLTSIFIYIALLFWTVTIPYAGNTTTDIKPEQLAEQPIKEKSEEENKQKIEAEKAALLAQQEQEAKEKSAKEQATREKAAAEEKAKLEAEKTAKEKEEAEKLANRLTGEVVRVVDGDTIHVEIDGKTEKVRLIGVDTPESVHPDGTRNSEEGKIASDYTKSQLAGKEVQLELDAQERDQYGRLLAYVWLGKTMFNSQLLAEGYAQTSTYPPNVAWVDHFTKAQSEAREAGKGFWSDNFTLTKEEPMPEPVKASSNNNYSNNNSSNNSSGTGTTKKETSRGKTYTADTSKGKIKGNSNSMIYHVPGGQSYNKISVNNVVYFNTEEEAQAAGYRRAKR